jgi:hypothetical protein
VEIAFKSLNPATCFGLGFRKIAANKQIIFKLQMQNTIEYIRYYPFLHPKYSMKVVISMLFSENPSPGQDAGLIHSGVLAKWVQCPNQTFNSAHNRTATKERRGQPEPVGGAFNDQLCPQQEYNPGGTSAEQFSSQRALGQASHVEH